ncbi:MAG: helix-turn-helix transcriptional regulator [Candidatus Cyclobacteriaceae bacterium M3_2C_046]
MHPKYILYIGLVIAFVLLLFIFLKKQPQISADIQYKLENNHSISKHQQEEHGYVNLLLFQQTGTALLVLFIPLLFMMFQNSNIRIRLKSRMKINLKTTPKPIISMNNFEARLLDKHPKLTPNDIRICQLLKDKRTSKEIANELNIMPSSVNTSRYRIRRKLHLKKDQDLTTYLHKF